MPRWLGRAVLTALAGTLIAYGLWMGRRFNEDPTVIFLGREAGAEWIVADEPVSLEIHGAGVVSRAFRITFTTAHAVPDTVMTVRALKHVNAALDQTIVFAPPANLGKWKVAQTVKLPVLQPGAHELRVVVQNTHGPVALWAKLEPAALSTGATWEVSADALKWSPARLAGHRPSPQLAEDFIPPWPALACSAPLWLAIVIAIGAAIFFAPRLGRSWAAALPVSRWRWIVMGAWSALALNNLFQVPAPAGFDVPGHLDYTMHVLRHWSVPYATDGWQMFQSPLYYFLNAVLFSGLKLVFAQETSVTLLRLLPLACGLLQIEIAYRVARRVFPDRADLQTFALLFAGALPMNLYLSHYVGNEPLAALLSSAAFALGLKLLLPAPTENNRSTPLWIGVCLGLAVLTKVSAIVMVAAAGTALLAAALRNGGSPKKIFVHASTMSAWAAGAVVLIAGWYYVRNWLHLGHAFVGGWDASRAIVWWQEPGFRVATDFFHFDSALSRPFYAGLQGVLDGLYASFWSDTYLSSATVRAIAPRWNYDLMSASLGFALVPTLALITGIGVAVWKTLARSDSTELMALVALASYALAVLHHILTVPFYCAVKSFYALGAMPALVLLAAFGFDTLARSRWARALAWGLFACWAFAAFGSYLILA